MRHELPRGLRATLGATGTVLVLGITAVIVAYGQGHYDDGYRVSAVFPASSQGIFTDGATTVKMRGIDIGTIADIELLDDGRARVTMFLQPDVEVPVAAMASIEPLSVFGPKFIRIDPGPTELTGPYLDEGGEITRTTKAPELTDILAGATELFEHIDPQEVIAIFDAVATGVSGLGPALASSIDDGATLLAVAGDHTADLQAFLDDAAALSSVAASRSPQILSIVEDLRTLVPVFIEHADDIDALLAATTSISTDFAELLDANRDAVDSFVRGGARYTDALYLHAEEFPPFIALLDTFFGRLSDVIRMPAHDGYQMAALRGFMSLEPCLSLGLCSSGDFGAGASGAGAEPVVALTQALVGPA